MIKNSKNLIDQKSKKIFLQKLFLKATILFKKMPYHFLVVAYYILIL